MLCMQKDMTNKYNLEVGDLLLRGTEIGVIKSILETPYGLLFSIYWTWATDESDGVVQIPEGMLCDAFFERFKLIKGIAI